MNTVVFYLGAASLYGAGMVCIRHTSPYSRAGGDSYLRRDRRRLFAKMLLTVATLCLATGIIAQYAESMR